MVQSSGERRFKETKLPQPQVILPEVLTQTIVFNYKKEELDHNTISALFEQINCIFGYQYNQIFYNIAFRKLLQSKIADNVDFLNQYKLLIQSTIVPYIYSQISSEDRASLTVNDEGQKVFKVLYQYPPTIRIQPSHTNEFKRPHRDIEYGHQPGEINFWMPLTDCSQPDSPTIELERQQTDTGDHESYDRVPLKVGEILRFHGSLLHHRIPKNNSNRTRISMDFRVAPALCWDKSWTLKGKPMKIQHGWEEFKFIID
ncbi:hypothetical protein BC833DRAFT_624466 [Globomyces pollinis-pini]|nr:hypothetical protein BC833DRAFT_624466 [Globomyces pollinis-pini]